MEFDRRPSTVAYMLRALVPSPGLDVGKPPPDVRAAWRRHRIDRAHLAAFLRLTELEAGAAVPLLYLHVLGFPLLMAILTSRAFPLGIWGSLQVRNHLLQRRPIAMDEVLDLEAAVVARRVLEKGVEFDLHTAAIASGEIAWESLNTFYYRGRFGPPSDPSPLARAPEVHGGEVARWRMPGGGGWSFGGLTGDYNGLHWSRWWARRFGFRADFLHPPRVLGMCLARLTAPSAGGPERLDAWLKGPVHYGAEASLREVAGTGGSLFALHADGEGRPAVVGSWTRPNLDEWSPILYGVPSRRARG